MKLSDDQEASVEIIRRWAETVRGPGELTIGGLAGTGKTTILGMLEELVPEMEGRVSVVAPTGRAALQLRRKGIFARTVHGFIYKFSGWKWDERKEIHEPQFEYSGRKDDPDFIVCDESSMVSAEMRDDLLREGLPILWVGDHGQLAPVGRDPGIMRKCAIEMNTILRQLAGSPILEFAHGIREGMLPTEWAEADCDALSIIVCPPQGAMANEMMPTLMECADQVLVATHNSRIALNRAAREFKEFDRDGRLAIGEKVICLRNCHDQGLYNGMLFEILHIVGDAENQQRVKLTLQDTCTGHVIRRVDCWLGAFGVKYPDLIDVPDKLAVLDYGYAITCHKAQGSEWPRVAVVEDWLPRSWSHERWRYTACTRAKEQLVYVRGAVREG